MNYIFHGNVQQIQWELNGISSKYSTEFFNNALRDQMTLIIPKTNLRINTLYNISANVYASGTKGSDYLLVRTYPGISEGVISISPSSAHPGTSGTTIYTLKITLWSTSNLENILFDVYYYNSVTYTTQDMQFKTKQSPGILFEGLQFNGDYSFTFPPFLIRLKYYYRSLCIH
eukprot:TRINITY_DN43027_c0_g1_i1.p1 TRINITY_DN43027_c0_g1~~TRINITY_DN43027_c0_g1_i1.p1  ORF type:complete len:173 (-),score=7.07 TRINITY_DN43027_c0_g1_i1:773-1291(-)